MLKIQPQHQAKTVGWPSGLRRYVQVVVFSKARVRIPLQSKLLFFISRNEFVFLHIINSLQVGCFQREEVHGSVFLHYLEKKRFGFW